MAPEIEDLKRRIDEIKGQREDRLLIVCFLSLAGVGVFLGLAALWGLAP